MQVAENIKTIKSTLSENVTLVAVSKTKPENMIMEAFATGHLDFGENKVQDLTEKHDHLPKDIHWHFIGHLQTNKVKYIAPFVYLIHGVDSFKLLHTINKEGEKNNRIISCLLQLKIAEEETKFGLSKDEINDILTSNEFKALQNVKIKGLMGMASYVEDENQINREFKSLQSFFSTLKHEFFNNDPDFTILSMGMSGDYELAVKNGSNMVRIGSSIFGEREYKK
ncbi:YggS family pyridoxal phosphate-dependent enzyme [Saccharicrinis sp. FJH62]|uniref:YggS family pyridoxal phosphate-dependent enzyme n=1 Tax=Saccharicrinis sp. FJH62 TaxID=3344657 RepID=UPI0035D4F4CB